MSTQTTFSLEKLRRQDGIANNWKSRRPDSQVVKFCPNPECRKPLPRCAICLLPMGCLNPFNQIKREGNSLSSRGNSISNSVVSDAGLANYATARARVNSAQEQRVSEDLSELARMPFTEWFTWCIKCKHGGHAHHMVGWFSKHRTCPVSNCNCKCSDRLVQRI